MDGSDDGSNGDTCRSYGRPGRTRFSSRKAIGRSWATCLQLPSTPLLRNWRRKLGNSSFPSIGMELPTPPRPTATYSVGLPLRLQVPGSRVYNDEYKSRPFPILRFQRQAQGINPERRRRRDLARYRSHPCHWVTWLYEERMTGPDRLHGCSPVHGHVRPRLRTASPTNMKVARWYERRLQRPG